jgi:hypothetical protein
MPKQWIALAEKATKAWNDIGANFKFEVDPSAPSSIICEELGDNAWLGLTTLRPDNNKLEIKQVLIRLNTRYKFSPPHPTTRPEIGGKPYDVYSVLLHELGHALHLGEDYEANSKSAMRPTIKPGEVRHITNDDVVGIKVLYP